MRIASDSSSSPTTNQDRTAARSIAFDCALIAVIWCVSVAIVNPIGDFPLCDDWAFARTVEHLLMTGEFRPVGWVAMSLLTNVAWGALFSLGTGVNFTVLRFSSLTAALAGLIGLYLLVRDMGQPRWLALLVTMTIAFNPLFFSVSNSFNTDALFFALVIWMALLLIRGRLKQSRLQESMAIVLGIAAVLSRQIALCLPLSFFLISFGYRRSRDPLRSSVPFIICAAAFVAFVIWLRTSGREPTSFSIHTDWIFSNLVHPGIFIPHILEDLLIELLYAGLFLLPVSVVCFVKIHLSGDRSGLRLLIPGGVITAASMAIYGFAAGRVLMPLWGPVLVKSGIGPPTLRDMYVLGSDNLTPLPWSFWLTVTILSMVGMWLLVSLLLKSALCIWKLRRETDSASALLLVAAGVYMLLTSAALLHDRWIILLAGLLAAALPTTVADFSHKSDSLRLGSIGFVLILMFALFSVAATRDYLEWNRVRWSALRALIHDQLATPTDIDGGFEFNGWYTYHDNIAEFSAIFSAGKTSWWWVKGDDYLVAFGPVTGYETYREYSYYNWLPPHRQTVAILKRQ